MPPQQALSWVAAIRRTRIFMRGDAHSDRTALSRSRLQSSASPAAVARLSAPPPPVHLRKEQVLPFRGALLDPPRPVHELGRAQDPVRSEREDEARVLQH